MPAHAALGGEGVTVAARIQPELREALEQLARHGNRTLSAEIRHAVAIYVAACDAAIEPRQPAAA